MEEDATRLQQRPWVIVGAGRLGRTLGLLAREHDIPIEATWNRREEAASQTERLLGGETTHVTHEEPEDALVGGPPRVIWLTVVDDAVEDVARRLVGHVDPADIVVHTSGVASSDILRTAGLTECHVGSIHVLQAITEPERALSRLGQSTWSVEGDVEVVEFGRELLGCIGVEPLVIEADAKPLYHASAVTTANLLVALMDAAFQMAQGAGLDREQARDMLLPLARSSVENLSEQETAEALSGPVARGDRATIQRHRDALSDLGDSNLEAVYEALIERAKRLAPAVWDEMND